MLARQELADEFLGVDESFEFGFGNSGWVVREAVQRELVVLRGLKINWG
jgi:hypothetical protein